MKTKLVLGSLVVAVFVGGFVYGRRYEAALQRARGAAAMVSSPSAGYRCAMHPSYHSPRPGRCPICNMDLEAIPAAEAARAIHVAPRVQQLIGVEYGIVKYGSVSKTIRAAARVEADESRLYRVQSKLDGWVDQLYVTQVGSHVKKDQMLLTVYNPQAVAAELELIKHAAAGMRMADSGARPPSDAAALAAQNKDAMLFAADKFKLELMGFDEAAIMTIARTGVPLYKIPVYSPSDGFVIERAVVAKQKMTPDRLYTIADLSSVYVIGDVFEYEAAGLGPGQPVALAIPYLPGKKLTGRVDAVLPVVDPASHTVKLRAIFNNRGFVLKPEMYGDMEIEVKARQRLTVPRTAVLDSGRRRVVFVDQGEGNLDAREVVVGQQFGDDVEILSGLRAGERIAISGNFLLDSESELRNGRRLN